jgi:hypothetical protein
MLSNRLRRLRRTPASVLLVLACGIALGILAGALFDKHGSTTAPAGKVRLTAVAHASELRVRTQSPSHSLPPASAGSNGNPNSVPVASARLQSSRLQSFLNAGVRRADALGGHAAAAVWISGEPAPLLSGTSEERGRMWSMSKAVVTIAALQATRERPDAELLAAMTDAIRRSDNCAIRRVILSLQELTGRHTSSTIDAFDSVLAQAGVKLATRPEAAGPEAVCAHYLDSHRSGLDRSTGVQAPLFGTDEWTIRQAIYFTHTLASGVYGVAGAALLHLMSLSKLGPLEESPPPSAPPLDWGAGKGFPRAWQPAWKAGWGGSRSDPPRFLAGQIVVLQIGGTSVAVAAEFHPDAAHEPTNDNPGITEAPGALETIFSAVTQGLESNR